MAHPHTASATGYRQFDGSQFGELQHCGWQFDGTEEDVRSFVTENLCDNDGQCIESIKDRGSGTFDVVMDDGADYRVYTESDESDESDEA